MRHAACVIGVFTPRVAAAVTTAAVPAEGLVVGVYTTSRVDRFEDATPVGVLRVSIESARRAGQAVPFLVDVRKRAFLPFDRRFFPDIDAHGHGVIGPAGPRLFKRIVAEYRKVNERHPELIVNLGPLRPESR
ncbi:hypothetical protein [Salinarimonas rosea]|uniref:hypothetical protein n=1 Tax=Salinarimonas rosea TaxID=552063 RepID=UPI00040BEE5D|nr:hypothetical protein [Salinarimonas rosea]